MPLFEYPYFIDGRSHYLYGLLVVICILVSFTYGTLWRPDDFICNVTESLRNTIVFFPVVEYRYFNDVRSHCLSIYLFSIFDCLFILYFFIYNLYIETQEWSWLCFYSTALSTGLTHIIRGFRHKSSSRISFRWTLRINVQTRHWFYYDYISNVALHIYL